MVNTRIKEQRSRLYTPGFESGIEPDNSDKGYFLLKPAGYSQKSHIDQVNRQDTYKYLFSLCTKSTKRPDNTEVFPLSHMPHRIILVEEPSNLYDPNAIRVVLVLNDKQYDLGYVPRTDQNILKTEYPNIMGGNLYSIYRADYSKEALIVTVAISYTVNCIFSETDLLAKRFDIL